MSIETLLEAAKFLEWQAQQQQKAREDELKENLRLQQLTEQRFSDVAYSPIVAVSHVAKAFRAEELHAESCPAPVPPSLPPPSVPVAVIPVPVVMPNPAGSPTLPVATLSPPAAPPVTSAKNEPRSPQEQSAAALLCSPHPKAERPASALINGHKNHQHHNKLIAPTNNNSFKVEQQAIQRYPGSIVSPPQQQQQQQQQHPLQPHPGAVLQPASIQNGNGRGSSPDDGKKRPGGAGTREVHNKLEKHRRAHLKECFETLKKNIPNIDEKKTSNLSVLRSALRYIQTLKRKEKEYEHDMERLAREKIATQQRLDELKNELSQWMDVDAEIDRVVRQATQPEEDQASTSTASEGEDAMDEDLEDEPAPRAPAALPSMPQITKAELFQTATLSQAPPTLTPITTATSFITQHVSIQQKAPLPPHPQPPAPSVLVATASAAAAPATPPQTALIPNHTKLVTASSLHPTVIAHASVSHPSVIQAVNHVIQGGAPKHIAHLASSAAAAGSVQLGTAHQPIGHITVHPVAHLGQHLPTLYPQPVAVTQPAMVGHITHTLNHAHAQVNGPAAPQAATTIVTKSAQMMAHHHPQLVGQTVLNPVTMVTMPSFPISTLKLA
ncbi:unnamed protein product [Ophioblennius macclurei]